MALTVFDKTQTPAVLPLSGGTMTGSIVFSPTTLSITGTTTNDSAAVGQVGEYVSAVRLVGSAINTTANATFTDITTISLTAGDWDVSGMTQSNLGTATGVLQIRGVISLFSGNTQTDHVDGNNLMYTFPMNANVPGFCVIPAYRISLSGTTTVYLKSAVTYSGGQPTLNGRISARRVR